MNKKKVAFICVHNSCRSQIAEALGKHLASDVFESYSAGTETKLQINQDAVRVMKELYKGYQQQTPWVGIANTNQKLMLQAASEFGLTPSSRSRIVAGSAKGKEPEDEMEALLGGDS